MCLRLQPVNMFKIAVILLVNLIIVKSQIPFPFFFPCPDAKPMENFDPNQYAGKWYEIEKYLLVFELGGKCVTADYSVNPNGTVTVVNTEFNTLTQKTQSISGIATSEGDNDGRLGVVFPSLPVQFKAPYWVLATDYTNYAVVWSCNDFIALNTRNAWILTRQQHPSDEIVEEAKNVLKENGISLSFLMKTNQDNC